MTGPDDAAFRSRRRRTIADLKGRGKGGANKSKFKSPHPKRGRGRPKTPRGPRPRTPIAVTIRGVEPWREWMASACSALGERSGLARIDTTDVIDVELKTWAKEMRLPESPPRF